MKYLLKYCFPFFAGVLFSHFDAQVVDAVKEWRIQDCFQYEMEHNIQINTTRLNEQIAVQDLSAAQGLKIPSLSASATNAFNNANNLFGNNNQLVNQLTTSGNYSFNSSIILWNGNYVNNNIKQRDLLNQSAGLSVKQSQNAVTLLITQAYLDILLAKENLKFLEDLVSKSSAKVKQGQLFYDAGSIAKKDLLQLQAQLAGDKYLRVQTQNAIGQNILMQFLIEAILISITGGLIGVALGITATKLVTILLHWPTLITQFSVILSFLVCFVTGVFFGYYPALKASKLDPIEALRYE